METKTSKAPLYVGDLELNVTESTLSDIFSKIGPILSIRVCRDKKSKESLGYAYVNYASIKDAERALETLNYTNIHEKPCRIMWYQRDPQSRQSNKACIFVKNLNKSIDNKMFHDIFSIYGNIVSCKLVLNEKSKKNYNYGYIQFSDDMSAQNAIQQLNGTIVHDEKLHVEIFEPRQERLKKHRFTNVYVKYIPTSFDEFQLKSLFEIETNGNITKMQFWKREYGISACLNFETHEEALLAVQKLNGKVMVDSINNKSHELYVARAEKRKIRKQELEKQNKNKFIGKTPEGANLYIKNLSKKIDDSNLRKIFAQFGTIRSVKVMRNSNGTSKGFAFVAYQTKESAMNAMHQMVNVLIDGKPLYISIAQKRCDRRKYLDKKMGNGKKNAINYENILNTMNSLRYQINYVLTPKLKEINNQIAFGQLNQLHITNQQYWLMLLQQKQAITQQIKMFRLQHKKHELSLIQLQQEGTCNQLLTKLDNVGMVEAEGIEIKNDMNESHEVLVDEKKSCEDIAEENNNCGEIMDRGKLKFRFWLNDTVGLANYLKVFEENEYDDISMIEFFDENTIENELGINKKIHSKLILKRVNEFKQCMTAFDKIVESNEILKQYRSLFVQNGILTLMDLMNDIQTKEHVINMLHMDCNKELEIESILNVILNLKTN